MSGDPPHSDAETTHIREKEDPCGIRANGAVACSGSNTSLSMTWLGEELVFPITRMWQVFYEIALMMNDAICARVTDWSGQYRRGSVEHPLVTPAA